MADYSKTTNFTAKDSLPTGNPSKTILGSEHDTEYSNIQTAIATKANKTGAPATTNNLAMLSATGDLADSLIETDGSGNISSNGSATFSALTLGGTLITSSATEINYNDITTLGTVQASKTVTADSNGNFKFDCSGSTRVISFDQGADEIWFFGNATDVGIYDSVDLFTPWLYTTSTQVVTFNSAIAASGGITGDLTGNADTATAFAASGTFNATGGDVTGSASSADGNYTVNLQIATDAVTMTELQTTAGTDTSASVGATSAWSIADGWYAVKGDGTSSDFQYQVYVQSAWRTVRTIPDDTTGGADQVLLISGSSRIYNNTTTRTIYYRKIAG